MATNENQIGVKAYFDINEFRTNQAAYDALLRKSNAATQAFYQTQIILQVKAAQQAKQSADAIVAALEKQTRAHQESGKSQSVSLSQLRQNFISYAAGITAAVGSLVGIYKTLESAAQFRGMIVAGNNLATSYGLNFQSILDGLDEVTHGALSMQESILIANRALIAGGADFADKIPQLYKIARAASIATGQDVGWVFETLTRGIAKASPLLIDNAEIYLKLGPAIDKYAESIDKTTEELSAQERQFAILNAILEQGGELVERVGEDAINATLGFKQLESAVSDFGKTLGMAASEIIGQDIWGFMASGVEAARQSIAMLTGGIVNLMGIMEGFDLSGTPQEIAQKMAINLATGKKYDIAEIVRDAKRQADEAFLRAAGIAAPSDEEGRTLRETKERELARRQLQLDAEANAARAEQLKKYGEKLADLQIKAGEDILDAENDFRQKSLKAWETYIQKTNDIIAQGIQDRAKIQANYNERIADAERDYQRGIEDLEYSHGQRLADIERDYQDRIADIQNNYHEDALDAARNLDAIGLVRARERRDKELAAASRDRDRAVEEERRNYERSLFELIRALSDKRDQAATDRDESLEEQRRKEAAELASAKESYRKQLAEAQKAFDERLALIRARYRQEDWEAQAHYLNQEAMLRNHLIAMQAIMRAYGIGGSQPSTGGGPRGRARGGVDVVNQPTMFSVGEAGPELMITAPLNRALPAPVMQFVNHTGDFSHQIDSTIRSSVAGIDGRITAAVTKVLREVLG